MNIGIKLNELISIVRTTAEHKITPELLAKVSV